MKLKGFPRMNQSLMPEITPDQNVVATGDLECGHSPPDDRLADSMQMYRKDLKYKARRLIGPRMRERFDSSDLVQETLLITVSKISEVIGKPEKVVFKWMLGVMRNRLMHHARDIHNHASFNELKFDTPDTRCADQSAGLLGDELRCRVMACLNTMSTLDQQIFQMRYQEELPLDEICRRTGKTEASVRGHLFRTVVKLRNNLGEAII
jgi:RNA polymerase sigma factor (sigma-70 family)